MIKEFILASVLSLSQPLYPHYYNLDNTYGNVLLDFYGFDYQNYNSYIINLNNGSTEISTLSSYDYDIYQKNDTTSYSNSGLYNFHDYVSWVYFSQNDEHELNLNYFYLEVDFTGYVEEFASVDDEIIIDCFFAIPGEDDTLLYDVSGICQITISPQWNYAYLQSPNWKDASSWLTSTNSYLVLLTDSIEGNDGALVDFAAISLYFAYNNVYIGDNEQSLNGSFTDFVYENFQEWIDYALTLQDVNDELRLENEQLNSQHVLSNVFEIVRGAFDGIINFLEIELMPNLTIGTIIFIPVVIGVIFFILKALVL